jgi:hypothetical protein
MKKEEIEMKRIAEIINYISSKLMDEGNNPELIAGVLASCSLSIYKSTLNQSDFEHMIDEISASKDKIGPFVRCRQAEMEDIMMAAHSKYLH